MMPSPDYVGEVARRFAVNLRDAIGTKSIRAVATDAGVSHATISLILAGEIYPDLTWLARLEQRLKTYLWPGLLRDRVAVPA